MSGEITRKASVSEIFSAFSGIGYAAMGREQPLSGSLGKLEKASSTLRYDLRQTILDGKQFPTAKDHQDMVALKALSFLQASLPILEQNAGISLMNRNKSVGGTLRDVILHIKDMAARELSGTDRPVVEARSGGSLTHTFKPSYFPDAPKTAETATVPDDRKQHAYGNDKHVKDIPETPVVTAIVVPEFS